MKIKTNSKECLSLLRTTLDITRRRDYIRMFLSGDKCTRERQEIIFLITGEKKPIAKCGVTEICKLMDCNI